MASETPHRHDRPRPTPGGAQQPKPSEEAARRIDASAEEAHEKAEDTKQRTQRLREQAGEAAAAAGLQIARQGREAAEQLREGGRSMLAEQKDGAAARLGHLREAIEAGANRLREADEPAMAAYADLLADRVEGGQRYLRGRDVDRLADEAGAAIRRHPKWVLAGLFIGGLALARFLRSSGEASSQRREAGERRPGPPPGAERDVAAQPPGPGPMPYPPQSEGIGTAGVRRDRAARTEPTTKPDPTQQL